MNICLIIALGLNILLTVKLDGLEASLIYKTLGSEGLDSDIFLKNILNTVSFSNTGISKNIFIKLMVWKDGFPHLLAVDVKILMTSLKAELSDLLKFSSIGTTHESKSIYLIELNLNGALTLQKWSYLNGTS
jgi:hypothetical protein